MWMIDSASWPAVMAARMAARSGFDAPSPTRRLLISIPRITATATNSTPMSRVPMPS